MSTPLDALAARLDAISRQLRTHAGDLAQVRTLAESTSQVLDDLVDRLVVVEQLAAAGAGAPAAEGAPVVSWLADPDPVALDALVGWVDQVLIHYPDTPDVLGDCWVWHPWVVEELLALHAAWTEAYAGSRASGIRAVDWHDRHRPGVFQRIGKALLDCGLAAHTPGHRADHTRLPAVPAAAEIPAAGAWWTRVHPGP